MPSTPTSSHRFVNDIGKFNKRNNEYYSDSEQSTTVTQEREKKSRKKNTVKTHVIKQQKEQRTHFRSSAQQNRRQANEFDPNTVTREIPVIAQEEDDGAIVDKIRALAHIQLDARHRSNFDFGERTEINEKLTLDNLLILITGAGVIIETERLKSLKENITKLTRQNKGNFAITCNLTCNPAQCIFGDEQDFYK